MPTELLQDNINKGVKSIELFSIKPSLNFGGMNKIALFSITYNFVFNIYPFIIFYRLLNRMEVRLYCVLDVHKEFEVFTNVGKTMVEHC